MFSVSIFIWFKNGIGIGVFKKNENSRLTKVLINERNIWQLVEAGSSFILH